MELEIFYSAVLNFLRLFHVDKLNSYLFIFYSCYYILQSLFWGVNDVIVVIGEEFFKLLKMFPLTF